MSEQTGDKFQKETKYFRNKLLGKSLEWANKPETYKNYSNSKTIDLPTELKKVATAMQLTNILLKRKSIRTFSTQPLSMVDLAFLLRSSTGIQRRQQGFEFRMAPSAGALYPIETYIVCNNIEGLEKAIYHYNIRKHSLEEIRSGDFRDDLSHAALEQKICAVAPVVFVWTAVFGRSKWKYAQRAYRYVYLDAGHIAQNLALAAVSISCGSCQIGAFFDDEVNSLIGVDGVNESAIYLSVVGFAR